MRDLPPLPARLVKTWLPAAYVAAVFIAAAPGLSAEEISGKVVAVIDGDTFDIQDDSKTVVLIRMNAVDAPEYKQPYGEKAQQFLAERIRGKVVRIECHGKDRFGRTLGTVFVDGKNVNRELVDEGLAWYYRRFDQSKDLEDAETAARKARKGLWADEAPLPPWDWRRVNRRPASGLPT